MPVQHLLLKTNSLGICFAMQDASQTPNHNSGQIARQEFESSKLANQLQQTLAACTTATNAANDYQAITQLFEVHPNDALLPAIKRSIDADNPRLQAVRQNLLQILDQRAPKYNFCTGGTTSLEINARGDYTRCSRYAQKKLFLGNILTDEKIKTLDVVENDSHASCNLNCKRRMCFKSNVIRAETRENFDQLIQLQGLKGDYRKSRHDRPSDIFIRWKMTDTCNFTCSYCSAWKTVNQRLPEIDNDSLVVVAEAFTKQFNNISLRITGGEPSTKKNYVPLMKFLNERLDKFVEIEVRTNFSFPHKQKVVFQMDWQNKLHYHIGCHVYDKNFRPWEFPSILASKSSITYQTKFVSTPTNQIYVDALADYFVANGIAKSKIKIIQDFRNASENSAIVPPAIKTLALQNQLSEDFYRQHLSRDTILAAPTKTSTQKSDLIQLRAA